MLHDLITFFFFFFNDTATTEIYTLSLHDALPIFWFRKTSATWGSWASTCWKRNAWSSPRADTARAFSRYGRSDRKSTRLNSSHGYISYAVFCLKKKKIKKYTDAIYTYNNQITV